MRVFGHDIRDTIRLDSQERVGVFKLANWVERKTNDVVNLMSDYVSNFACRQCDMEYQWEVKLRRLKRIRDELRSVEAYLAGNGDSAAFKGDRNGWIKYHKLVQGYYNGFVKELSRFINNILMTHTLSYEKWSDIRSQLETIIGHEVEIKESILNLWEEKRKKEQAQNMK